jgi:hypothetical protein
MHSSVLQLHLSYGKTQDHVHYSGAVSEAMVNQNIHVCNYFVLHLVANKNRNIIILINQEFTALKHITSLW